MGLFLEPDAFLGTWQLLKEMDDRRAGEKGAFRGTAVVRPGEGGGFTYAETGQVQLGGGPILTATRRYLWVPGSGGFAVLYDDGRAFHDVDLGGPTCSARHFCAPDTYDVHYDFRDFPDWCAVWEVQGPKKDYRMVCRYRRDA